MTSGESCGNEGNNVYVNSLINSNTDVSYKGCYADKASSPVMTFIGEKPPTSVDYITNGDFSESKIKNNTYKYLTWDTTTVPGWNFNCVLANNSSAWGYTMPYPNGNQIASIQKTQELWTGWISFPSGTYTLSFMACGRNCCDNSGISNQIDIFLASGNFTTATQLALYGIRSA